MTEQDEQLTALFHQYGPQLQRMCYLYLKDYHLAEDAVSETFLKAYRTLPSFRWEASPKTWLVRIAINICKSQMRSSAYREQTLDEIPEPAILTDTSKQTEERLWGCREIMSLPEKYREVILLRYYQEFTVKEIARILGLPASTISGRLKRAKAMLKPLLEEGYFDET